jgi:hypothetical protein
LKVKAGTRAVSVVAGLRLCINPPRSKRIRTYSTHLFTPQLILDFIRSCWSIEEEYWLKGAYFLGVSGLEESALEIDL